MAEFSRVIQLLSINGECFNFKLDEGAIVTEYVENGSVLPENNTFDVEWMDKAIQDILNSNFNNNISLSKHTSYITRFDLKSNEFKFYETGSNRALYTNIDINMILPENRKKFKKSNYYNRVIDIKELENDKDIFSIVPRVIINGVLLDSFKVFCNESKTDIILQIGTDINKELQDQMLNRELDVTVITFPRTNEYEEQKYTKNISTRLSAARLRSIGARLGRVLQITSEYFQIPLDKGLVHPENILVFSNEMFIHGARVESYYPNVYRVVNTPEGMTRFTLYIFYNGSERDIKNELALYQDNVDLCNEFQNGNVPNYIKQYVPINIEYSIKDYRKSKFNFPIEYKVDVLQRLIDFNAAYAKDYLKYCNINNTYYLDIENTDLESKVRLDNRMEIDVVSNHVAFNEARYVFIFKKDLMNHNRDFRIFIDGEYYVPDHHYDDTFYDFIYIPTSVINQDSIFSVEMIYAYTNSLKGTLYNFDEEFILTLGEFSDNVLAKDIKIYTGGQRLPSSMFKGFIETDAGMAPIKLDSNTHVGNRTIYIRILDSNLYGQPIEFIIDKSYIRTSHKYHEIRDNTISVPSLNDENVNKLLVYKNGRLLATNMYSIGEVEGKYFIQLAEQDFSMYDIIHIEINPYFSNEVIYESQISNDGFIDLYGKITKPIDTRWYEIYLNGRRLEDNNIKIISPHKAIIHNVKATVNLVFLEKNRDEEYFAIRNKNIEDLIWENEAQIREKLLDTTIENLESMYNKL